MGAFLVEGVSSRCRNFFNDNSVVTKKNFEGYQKTISASLTHTKEKQEGEKIHPLPSPSLSLHSCPF